MLRSYDIPNIGPLRSIVAAAVITVELILGPWFDMQLVLPAVVCAVVSCDTWRVFGNNNDCTCHDSTQRELWLYVAYPKRCTRVAYTSTKSGIDGPRRELSDTRTPGCDPRD